MQWIDFCIPVVWLFWFVVHWRCHWLNLSHSLEFVIDNAAIYHKSLRRNTGKYWKKVSDWFSFCINDGNSFNCRDVCQPCNVIEVDGTLHMLLLVPKNTFNKLYSEISFWKSCLGHAKWSTDLVLRSFATCMKTLIYSWTTGGVKIDSILLS